MQNIPLRYVVNLFFRRFALIFLPDFISNCVYTAKDLWTLDRGEAPIESRKAEVSSIYSIIR